jgi:RHS repeat-associated protein
MERPGRGGHRSEAEDSRAGPGPIDPPPGETESMGFNATTYNATSAATVVREFDYDDTNRMRAVKHDGVVVMNYLYNGKGERVYKTGGGNAVTMLYDEAGKWIGDYDGNGQPIQQVIWLDDLPVGLLVGAGANQKLYYIEADMLGTPRVVIDPARNVAVWRWDLAGEAFGDSAPEQDVDGDGIALVFDMRFQGQKYDAASGLSYNYFRDYDPATGRYVQSDPIGLDGGISTYGYAGANSLVFFDPLGLQQRAGAGWYVMGLHTNVNAQRSVNVGHAWISLRAVGATEVHTYSVWPDGRVTTGGTRDPIPDNGDLSDMRRDMEALHGYPEATQSVFFLLNPAQKRRLDRFMSQDFEYDTGDYNCADFSVGALRSATGISLDVSDISSAWVSVPSELSRKIDAFHDPVEGFEDVVIANGVRAVSPTGQRRVINFMRGN